VLGVVGLAVPTLAGGARRRDIDARSEALFDGLVRELCGAVAVGQIGDDEIGVRGLHAVSLMPGTPSPTPHTPLVERHTNRRGNMAPRPRGASEAASSRSSTICST